MKRGSDGAYIRKGPWHAEEDEVLINHVKKNGPRDWSSIRSKGLLPRTGKSCRLRWVNKLRPNLKTGCKFSAEEERLVIELQAQVGNKWAEISTYLPGRTDNDVKNFWSSRKKRLQRLLHHRPSPLKSHKTKVKRPLVHQVPKDSTMAAIPSCQSNCPHVEPEELRLAAPLPEMMRPNVLNFESGLSMVDASGIGSGLINDPSVLLRESKSSNFFDDLTQDMLDYFDSVSSSQEL
ncbi:transcription factor DUO1-like [Humulus lupulus]|uniref:transcription factor DUO1-like n=1 Tax=Humulus lupulus TaxID=3486 RepID=UPI002B4030FD|nr:transcription factor DUO1-like [Humulus lupulus]